MKAASNARWVFASHLGKTVLQLGAVAILSRILEPAEYGLMVMAMVVVTFLQLFQDLGTSAAIVQRRRVDQGALSTIFWLNLVIGLFCCLSLLAAALPLAWFFRAPGLVPVIVVLSLALPLQGLAAVHQALLERGSRFRFVAAAEVLSTFLGIAVAVGFALRGYGAISLAAQVVVTTAFSSALFWAGAPWRPKLMWSAKAIRETWAFSSRLTVFTFVGFLSRNGDTFIIARYLGEAALGVYTQAIRLMTFSLQSVTFVASRALFPIMSRQQGDLGQMTQVYLMALNVVAAITLPMACGLWVIRDVLVQVLLGEQWAGVPSLLFWLAPVGGVQSLVSTTGVVLKATGRTDLLLVAGVIGAVLHMACFLIGARFGLEGVAVGYLVATVANSVPCLWLTRMALQCAIRGFAEALAGPAVVAGLMTVLVAGIHAGLQELGASAGAILVICLSAGAGIYAIGLHWWDRRTFEAVIGLVHSSNKRSGPRVP